MIDLGLTPLEFKLYVETLASTHRMRAKVEILDRDERSLDGLDARIVSGAVQIDVSADVTRSLSMTLFDPRRRIRFDAGSPADGALYADNFLAASRGAWVPSLGRWVDCPVFRGPLTSFERSGGLVKIEAKGKESLMLAPHLATQGYQIPKRMRLDDAIRRVASRVGEQRFNLPDLSSRLSRTRIVEAEAEPWKVLRGGEEHVHFDLAKRQRHRHRAARNHDHKGRRAHPKPPGGLVNDSPGNLDVIYDGRGDLTVRHLNVSPIFTFTDEIIVGEQPSVDYALEDFRNFVVVKGAKHKGAKHAAHGHASLPASHPLSPQSLGRNGTRRYMTEPVEADNLKSDAQCRRRAHQILRQRSTQGVTVEFECLPVPFLEENDVARIDTDEVHVAFPLRQATIPLTHDATMSVGFLKSVRVEGHS